MLHRVPKNYFTRLSVLVSCLLMSPVLLMAQTGIVVTKTAGGATVKTPTDTLHLTVCGATSIHVVGAPNTENGGEVLAGTPKEPWMVDACTPAKFTLDIPSNTPTAHDEKRLWKPVVATLDTGSVRVLISLDSG
ncbi:MAG: hypothetical protein WB950_18715, partial [Acidobacteriaceae bacterium]